MTNKSNDQGFWLGRILYGAIFIILGAGLGALIGTICTPMPPTILVVNTASKTIHLTADKGSLSDPVDGECPREVGSFTLPDDEKGITLTIKRHKAQ